VGPAVGRPYIRGMKSSSLVVLAAGMGSRYGGLKQLDRVGPSGEAIADYSIFDAQRAGFDKVVFVIRKSLEQDFIDVFAKKWEKAIDVQFAFQELDTCVPAGVDPTTRQKPWGTAHAVLAAKDAVTDPFAVINADDFYGPTAFSLMKAYLDNTVSETRYGLLGYVLENTLSEHGGVSRGVCRTRDGKLVAIHERKNVRKEGDVAMADPYPGEPDSFDLRSPVSMNYWGYPAEVFGPLHEAFQRFALEHKDHPKEEMLLPGIVQSRMDAGEVSVDVITCEEHWIGVTYKEDKPIVEAALRDLVAQGQYPPSVFPA
jgi:NDP-sugar pyrophosphorylase family protein